LPRVHVEPHARALHGGDGADRQVMVVLAAAVRVVLLSQLDPVALHLVDRAHVPAVAADDLHVLAYLRSVPAHASSPGWPAPDGAVAAGTALTAQGCIRLCWA